MIDIISQVIYTLRSRWNAFPEKSGKPTRAPQVTPPLQVSPPIISPAGTLDTQPKSRELKSKWNDPEAHRQICPVFCSILCPKCDHLCAFTNT